ncbi:MAG: hypothetical protein KC636_36590, partial [Myxococcales bacterium]|nr:hypothetical protein [Myxococcales bacterium]
MKDSSTQRATPRPHYRRDYQPPDHTIDAVELRFELDERCTRVHARLHVKAREGREGAPLKLHGERLRLLRVVVDGRELGPDAYEVDDESLTLRDVPAEMTLETEVEINPSENRALSGLYTSSGSFCTQCEAE